MNIGWGEVLVIALIALLLGGTKRLPDLGRALGRSVREFQDALKGERARKPETESKE